MLVKKKEKPTWRAGCCSLFSCSVVSDSLPLHGLQHARPPWPLSPGACSDSCPLSLWCHPTILSSLVPLSSCLQYFPSIRVFSNERLFASGGESIGASVSVLLMNIQDWFPLELTGLISLQSKGLWRVFYNTAVQKHQFLGTQPSLLSIHPYVTTGKTIALTRWTFVGKVMSLLFNSLSMLVIAFLARSKCILISWLQSPSAVILEPKKIKSATVSIVSPSIFH